MLRGTSRSTWQSRTTSGSAEQTALWRSVAPDTRTAEGKIRLPQTLQIHCSRSIEAALTAAHVLVGFGVAPLALSIFAKLAAWVILALSLARLLTARRRPVSLTLNANGRLDLTRAGSQPLDCTVDAETTVLPWLVVLRLKTGKGTETLVLPQDALGAEEHRQLRTWLRWRATIEMA
jgi:hypothetical protein